MNISEMLSSDPIRQEHEIWVRDDKRFQRINFTYREKDFSSDHIFSATIDVKTGGIYLDERRRKIYAKNLVLVVLRPIHTIVKTAYHASIIFPAYVQFNDWMNKKISGKEAWKNLGLSTLDIVRTPYYGSLMTVVHLAALIIAPFNPNSLYRLRSVVGSLEAKMLRLNPTTDASNWILAECFSPHAYFLTTENSVLKPRSIEARNRFCKRKITYMRECNNLFINNGFKLSKDETFVSAAYQKKGFTKISHS